MAKVLFVMKYPLEDIYAVKNKFDGEMNACLKLGHDVSYIAYDHKYTYLIHDGKKTKIKKIHLGEKKFYIHTLAFYDLYESVIRIISCDQFDIAYIRRAPLSIKALVMFHKLKETSCKIVVEVPTYTQTKEKEKRITRRIYASYSRMCWRIANKSVLLYTLIGEKAENYNGVRAINIENGIDVLSMPLRVPKYDEEKIHLLAVASMSKWHGYDRLIHGIKALDANQRSKIVFDVVGDEGDGSLNEWKNLVEDLRLTEQVLFHGRKVGHELDPFFEKGDVGICSLGMYRNGFQSGSILKLREYMARGLPFVFAAEDPAIHGELAFCMKVTNNDDPIDVNHIIEFAYKMRKTVGISKQMRNYAEEEMSWKTQMRSVFDTLKDM